MSTLSFRYRTVAKVVVALVAFPITATSVWVAAFLLVFRLAIWGSGWTIEEGNFVVGLLGSLAVAGLGALALVGVSPAHDRPRAWDGDGAWVALTLLVGIATVAASACDKAALLSALVSFAVVGGLIVALRRRNLAIGAFAVGVPVGALNGLGWALIMWCVADIRV
jgi:hypothetical protein